MQKEIFIVRNRITLQAPILDCSETAVYSHPFSKISPENISGKVLHFLVKLQTDCLELRLYTKMTPPRMFSWKSSAWTVQKQSSTVIHFRKFIQEILVVASFIWSNYRLTVQSGVYILKWLDQECFLGYLPSGLFRSSCPQPSIFKNISRKYRWQSPSFGQITDWLFRVAIIY